MKLSLGLGLALGLGSVRASVRARVQTAAPCALRAAAQLRRVPERRRKGAKSSISRRIGLSTRNGLRMLISCCVVVIDDLSLFLQHQRQGLRDARVAGDRDIDAA